MDLWWDSERENLLEEFSVILSQKQHISFTEKQNIIC